MKFAPIICELRRCLGAIPVYYITPSIPVQNELDYPFVCLVPGGLELGDMADISALTARYSRRFAVTIDALSTEADEAIECLIDGAHNAMIGFRPYANGSAIRYLGGAFEYVDGDLVRWTDEYEIEYTRGYTLRPASTDGLPLLTPDF